MTISLLTSYFVIWILTIALCESAKRGLWDILARPHRIDQDQLKNYVLLTSSAMYLPLIAMTFLVLIGYIITR